MPTSAHLHNARATPADRCIHRQTSAYAPHRPDANGVPMHRESVERRDESSYLMGCRCPGRSVSCGISKMANRRRLSGPTIRREPSSRSMVRLPSTWTTRARSRRVLRRGYAGRTSSRRRTGRLPSPSGSWNVRGYAPLLRRHPARRNRGPGNRGRPLRQADRMPSPPDVRHPVRHETGWL